MPAKTRDDSVEGRREEKKRTKPSREGSDRKERQHRSTSHRKSSTKERVSSRASVSSNDSRRRVSVSDAVKTENDASKSESKTSLPYPTFSKAHSKEAVGSHPSLNIFTPPATDVDGAPQAADQVKISAVQNAPPSPPLTDRNAGRQKTNSVRKSAPVATIAEEEKTKGAEAGRTRVNLQPKTSRSSAHLRSSSEAGTNGSPPKTRERTNTPLKNVQTTSNASQRSVSQPTRTSSPVPSAVATESTTNHSSDGTSIAPEQPSIQRPGSKVLPPSAPPLLAHSQSRLTPEPATVSRQQTPLDVVFESPASNYSAAFGGPPPPPPPPPPHVPSSIPKVDYLLHHGGLNQAVPKNLLYAGKPMAVQQAAMIPGQQSIVIANLFEPYNSLLKDFEKVVSRNGSLAVATGYRSVARRLLDRLEAVFARDISAEECQCSLCANETQLEDSRGVSWGEILELVSGRRDLPNWPPFAIVASPSGLGISLDMQAPMQKVDIDVPEEYREHYIRQSRKTKQSVDKWLSRQADDPSSPPEEVDDETLTFAILTHLPAEQRPLFKDLLGIVDRPLEPPRRAPSPDKGQPAPPPTPQPRMRLEHIVVAGMAIQRLYRLSAQPRDPETAIFLLNNTSMHNALATLAAISSDEWDILISGRFDGFLRSGADDNPEEATYNRYTPSRTSSRGPTPLHMNNSRISLQSARHSSSGNAQYGAPIALDEETEIATLAEIERDIYVGMEALEDAFETLHQRAEAVRRTLRERSAGLAAAAQRRRGNSIFNVEVRTDTPASTMGENWEAETDDGLGDWDGVSEIAPDDSASNVSTSRRRRPKRRTERRTPALIEEDDEDDAESEGTQSPRKR